MKLNLNPQNTLMLIRLSIAIAGLTLAALGVAHLLVNAEPSNFAGAGVG
ncbi:hypothetical protein [Acidianus sulfidivorans]|nr:hypothetical protein [Acidianus sulfidivorans]